jgi:hypothetical protein
MTPSERLADQEMSALLPTLSARPDPQVWYTSTAGNLDSVQLGRVRERGLSGSDPSLAFMEWSSGEDIPDDMADPALWARANPGLGIRISPDHIARELPALGTEAFARERLSVGTYPVDGGSWSVIPQGTWAAAASPGARL